MNAFARVIRSVAAVAVVLVSLLAPIPAQAQCQPDWLPGDGFPGVYPFLDWVGGVTAIREWDPDGTGPRGPVIVIGGTFSIAGRVTANNVALFDPSTREWSAMGAGFDSPGPTVFATLPNGDLIAGGDLHLSGGTIRAGIARWDGSAWSPLASVSSSATAYAYVNALAVLPNGDLVAGGFFTSIEGVAAARIARWNGSVWAPLGTGLASECFALAVLPNGDLVAGGKFTKAGGATAKYVARWDGSAWSKLGDGPGGEVHTFDFLPNGDLIAGGRTSLFDGSRICIGVARWNGLAWGVLDTGLPSDTLHGPGYIASLAVLPDGRILAAGASGLDDN